MPPAQEPDEHPVEHFGLPDDDFPKLGEERLDEDGLLLNAIVDDLDVGLHEISYSVLAPLAQAAIAIDWQPALFAPEL